MEAMLITEPPCSPIQASVASAVHSSGAHRLTSKVFAKRSWYCWIIGPYAGLVPALLTKMSMLPNVSRARLMQRQAWSSSTACAATPMALPAIWAAASSAVSCLRDVTTTLAPAAGDGVLVHLVGPVGQPQGAQVGGGHGEWEVVGDPGAAVHLDGAVDNLQRDVGGGDLDGRDLGLRLLIADRVHHVGGLEGEQPDHLNVDARLGNPVLDVGIVGDWLAAGDPRLGAFAHQLQRAF